MLNIKELIKGENRYYKKDKPFAGQLDLFGNSIPIRKDRKRRPPEKLKRGQPMQVDNNEIFNIELQNVMSG